MQLTALPVGILSPERIDGEPVDPFFDDWCTFCLPANLTGQPAASVPIGAGAGGLPVGLQIIGRRWEDATVLGAAAAVERTLPWATRGRRSRPARPRAEPSAPRRQRSATRAVAARGGTSSPPPRWMRTNHAVPARNSAIATKKLRRRPKMWWAGSTRTSSMPMRPSE
jgi:hypothetical protein